MNIAELQRKWADERAKVQQRFGRPSNVVSRLGEETDRSVMVEVYAGTDIEDACQEITDMAQSIGKHVQFDFNGVTMTAGDGSAKAMVDYYHNPETHRRL